MPLHVRGSFGRSKGQPRNDELAARSRRSRALTTPLAALTALVLASPARAQVNAEALRSTLKTNPRFLWLEGAIVGRTGNTRTMAFSGSIFAGLTADPHLFFTKVSADYGEALGRTNVARWMTHARYNYRVTERLALEGLAQAQHDRFRRLEVRDLYGAGVRITLENDQTFELFTGTTYVLEHEVIEGIPGFARQSELWNRSSTYLGLNTTLGPLVQFSSTTYVQPRIDRPSDFRILSETWLSVTITKRLSARVSGSVWYDSDPPFGVRTYDVEVKNSLAVRLD